MDTTCIFDHSVDADICQGLKIDVEFLDGVPSGKWNRKFTLQCARLMALLRSERVPIHGIPKVQKQSRLILKLLPTHWIRWKVSTLLEKKIKQCKFDSNCEFIRYISAPMRKKRLYESAVYLDFEGYKMPVPVGYDEYLRDQYGDYMKLPPESQRKPITDNLVFYDLDHSYLDYKGKYYCVDKKNKPQQ
jgi:lipopolysaccharide cholinephosphotransferase